MSDPPNRVLILFYDGFAVYAVFGSAEIRVILRLMGERCCATVPSATKNVVLERGKADGGYSGNRR
ncbi:hypothetical protein BU25DRAFT_408653 [Macroventuria anomochaeta]|uniref:Uncharacterized protein n=1 Tax=Macroventuria anomochaeta TaxID=301207 RepID=A0ACB6S6Y7_9PLEO|nr:uncharacterized protein BU25DRAFT_408653 [Macroventuria anomochaeta]KAF2630051.1 hypothetical protein BU25DRAFT_408653 [Macroventuria anomochaeta]